MTDGKIDQEHWSRHTADWIAWARTPGHDAFWAYRTSFSAFVGNGWGEAIDIGCGEGRVSRLLKECGYRVTGRSRRALRRCGQANGFRRSL
jgi:hypothetical protein